MDKEYTTFQNKLEKIAEATMAEEGHTWNKESATTLILRKVLEAYDDIPRENFRSYLKDLIQSSARIDNE
tara:strand:+ start:204 stop:413 length:210 start_codon:yes stop_codon:yes gene_type:complete